MKKFWLLFISIWTFSAAALPPVTLRELPEHMRSYKNYIVVMVHGMGGDAGVWDSVSDRLSELVDDPDFAAHLYAYSLPEPYAAYYGNAAQLGDRQQSDNWLERARRDFIASHPDWPPEQLPAKFILLTHSMGALAARSYIYSDALAVSGVRPEEFPRGFYQNDVKKVVFIAPVHKGSSMADFLFHYMASDTGYKFGASGLLEQILNKLPGQAEVFAARLRSSRQTADLPVINEVSFTETELKNYLREFIRADYEKNIADAGLARERVEQSLKNRLLEIAAELQPQSGADAALLSGEWFKQQVETASAYAVEQLAAKLVQEIKQARQPYDDLGRELTGLVKLEDIYTYLENCDLQAKWTQYAAQINDQMNGEGFQFRYSIKVDKKWPSGYQPSLKLTYQNWSTLTPDLQDLKNEIFKVLEEYQFSIKLTKDSEYQTSLSDLRDKADMLARLYAPLERIWTVITELDSAPLLSFPSLKVLLEVNNYCASDAMKEFLDFMMVNYFQKQALEKGAIASLLNTDPVTAVLNTTELPAVYDPVAYRNVIARGGVAFDRKKTKEFNQFFYGDLPALRGLHKDIDNFMQNSFFSTLLANAYQARLLTLPEYQRLPSGEARLTSLLLSYARGLFTQEGDGAVDIDSLMGRDIPALAGARAYAKKFETPALGNYVDQGFWQETLNAEAACVLIELSFKAFGAATPPYVRGSVRLAPLFNFVAKVLNYKDELVRDLDAHRAILQAENALPLLQQALYDAPLLILHNVYTVSGNELTALGAEALQGQTAAGQENTSVPLRKTDSLFYLPLAYNVKAPQVRLDAELCDFAPQLAQVEYSLNFAPYAPARTDRWGRVALPDFSVAEGQNIIAFRLTNKLGQTAQQYLRVIRSSTPLLASELFPEPQTAVNTANFSIQAVFYNAQFVSNNIDVSSVDAVLLDGAEISADKYTLSRGANHAYQNFLKINIPVVLTEGRHTVALKARDAYAHQNETHWFFDVDLTVPEILLPSVPPVSGGQPVELDYVLQDAPNQNLQDLQISLRDAERLLWTKRYALVGAGQQREIIATDNVWADGEYILEIGVSDLAGNRAVSSAALVVDSAPPQLQLTFSQYICQPAPLAVFTASSNEDITGQIILFDRQRELRFVLPLENITENFYAVTLNNTERQLADGLYFVSVQAADLAGNQTTREFGGLIVAMQGPQIAGLRAEPAILSRNSPAPYQTKILAGITSALAGGQDAPSPLIVSLTCFNKSSGLSVFQTTLNAQDGVYAAEWSAAEARYASGVYLLRVVAEDALGNKTVRECEVIKDGIAPEIALPADGAALGGITLITGRVSDTDWTNTQDFEFYAVYWASGFQPLPPDLRDLDRQVWQDTLLETPYDSRYGGASRNISYRAAPQNTLLGWWDASSLPPGAYTLLITAAEKNIGPSACIVRHVYVEPAAAAKLDLRLSRDFPAVVDYALQPGITFNMLNNGQTANVNAEIVDKYGRIVKHNFWPEVPGVLYDGHPADCTDGAYLWQEQGQWHLRLVSPENCQVKILLSGVDRVLSAGLPYKLDSGLLQIETLLTADDSPEIIFTPPSGAANLYINVENSSPRLANSAWLRLGAAQYTPQSGSYVLALTNAVGAFSLFWDGRLGNGGYADGGAYILRLTAAGTDGRGIYQEQITFNILTPLSAQPGGQTPADGCFEVFGDLNKITLAYTLNKDSWLRAEIIDETGCTISVLPEQKVLGSALVNYLSWNGAYPQFASSQRLLQGLYRAVLIFRTADQQQASLVYDNIRIRDTSSGTLARLEPIGETVLFNGQSVQASAGSAEYYWSARGAGAYTVPKTFTYELGLSGSQTVTAAPFVPFAGLYHRGFKRLRFKVIVDYEWDIDFHSSGGQETRSATQTDTFVFEYTPGQQEVVQHGQLSQMHKPVDKKFDGAGTSYIRVTIQDMAGTVMYTGQVNWSDNFSSLGLNGALRVNISAQPWRNDNWNYCQSRVTIKLLDDVLYSRLTNRYYAWYGYVNKYYPQELAFSAMWNDLGKLGLVPSSYFLQGLNNSALEQLFAAAYPQVLQTDAAAQNQDIIAALQKVNVLYEALPYSDDSYYNYLADEYSEFIPMTFGQTIFVTENPGGQPELVAKAKVFSDYTVTENILWPASEEYILQMENQAKQLIETLVQKQEINLVDYGSLPRIFDKQAVDFGGLGASRLLLPAALGKRGHYQRALADIAALLPKSVERNSLTVQILKKPADVLLSFEDGSDRAVYAPERQVLGQYAAELTGNVFAWSTEQDFFLKNGVIDSPPLNFNADAYAPDSGWLYLQDAYFAALNRRADLPAQNVTPIDYYTFLERDYYQPLSGHVLNPNLDIERWDIQVYDQTGRPNQDLSVTETELSNEELLKNRFKIKLNLDAVEKRYVAVHGSAAGAYELLYFDGANWQTISAGAPTEGRLGWWDVTRLNGSYTVVLKVYAATGAYSTAKQDVFIGQLWRRDDNREANKRVGSPYKRAEVYFQPRSYAEDKFITIAPVKLQDLKLQNRPELYTLGPVAEILPHGSVFPEADQRPTVVFRYSREDLAELQRRGVAVDRLGLYYLNASGALEKANSEIRHTEYGQEIWTVLSHFSPYAILAGDVPPLPTFNVAFNDLSARNLRIMGRAAPQSFLEIYLDDDEYFGDADGEDIFYNVTVTTDVAAWIFARRGWQEDYSAGLAPEQQAKLLEARRLLQEMYLAALADNQAAEQEYAGQYAALITRDRDRAEVIRDFLLANNQAALVTANSGVALQSEVDLQLGLTAPTLNDCLPEALEIILRQSFPVLQGRPARIFPIGADALGYFSCDLPLDLPTCSIYVTYALTGNIQNRPVARMDFIEDPEAPHFLAVDLADKYFSQQNFTDGVTLNISLDEEAKILLSCYDDAGELLDWQYYPAFARQHSLVLRPEQEGVYYYAVQAIDPAGNQSQPYGCALSADFTPPDQADVLIPRYINPSRQQLRDLITVSADVAISALVIADWEIISGDYVEKAYPYELILSDAAGNTTTLSGLVTVDVTAPLLSGFNFGPQAADGVRIFWPAADASRYRLTVQQLHGSTAGAYSTDALYYYDQQISRDCFYEYTLQAEDESGNQSNILRRLIYTADNTLQFYISPQETVQTYKDLQLHFAATAISENNLFVVQQLETPAVQPEQPGLIRLGAAYRLLNSAGAKDLPLELTISFAPKELADKFVRRNSLQIKRYADGWQTADIEIITSNYQANTLTFRASGYGDYVLFGEQEYWVYDQSPALLRFLNTLDNDYLDPAVTLAVQARDAETAIDIQNMWLLLDNVRYVLPPAAFAASNAVDGRSGYININLQDLLGHALVEGEHVLTVYALDLAGNTANATLRFSTAQNFRIEDILPAPNPFTDDGLFFTYQLSRPAERIELKIYDVNGRLVRALDNCSNQTGFNKTRWDGRDRQGAFVANDVYLYVLKAEFEGRSKIFKGKIAALR